MRETFARLRPHSTAGIYNRNNHWCVLLMFSVDTTTKSRRFQIFRFQERFRKAPFSWRISVDGRPNRRLKESRVFKFSRGNAEAFILYSCPYTNIGSCYSFKLFKILTSSGIRLILSGFTACCVVWGSRYNRLFPSFRRKKEEQRCYLQPTLTVSPGIWQAPSLKSNRTSIKMINREKTNWASCLSSDTQLQKQHDRKKITTLWAFAEQHRLDTHPEIDNILGNSKKSFFNFLEKLPTKIINCLHFNNFFISHLPWCTMTISRRYLVKILALSWSKMPQSCYNNDP